MLQPRVISVLPLPDYRLLVEYATGERKIFDVKPYIKGEWYGQLKNVVYFNAVTTDGYTVTWPDGQDICPDELYAFSQPS